jgi:hypothetical protein
VAKQNAAKLMLDVLDGKAQVGNMHQFSHNYLLP